MSRIDAFEAKPRLSELLDRVETGEEVVTTWQGRPIARLVPFASTQQARAGQAVLRLRELRRGVTLDGIDWRELRGTGRR